MTNIEFKACFPLGGFVRANREKSNLIGWRQTLTTSPFNHICFSLVRAKNIAKWKTSLNLYLIYLSYETFHSRFLLAVRDEVLTFLLQHVLNVM
jgi:hypothetical protein